MTEDQYTIQDFLSQTSWELARINNEADLKEHYINSFDEMADLLEETKIQFSLTFHDLYHQRRNEIRIDSIN